MIDLENTISNLETNIRWIESTECPKFPGWGNVTMAMRDALELLKEKEPVKPEVYYVGPDKYRFYNCPVCKMAWYYKGNYCLGCGRPVKWDDT